MNCDPSCVACRSVDELLAKAAGQFCAKSDTCTRARDHGGWCDDGPCAEYDAAGEGAGIERDGKPQCAACGYMHIEHESPVAPDPVSGRPMLFGLPVFDVPDDDKTS